MRCNPLQTWAIITALAVLSYTTLPQPAFAATEEHVVSLDELQKDATATAGARSHDIDDVVRIISLPQAQATLAKANLTPERVKTAVAKLSDEEIAQLAQKARTAEKDVQGGFIVGLLALIGLIVVIIVVVTVVRNN